MLEVTSKVQMRGGYKENYIYQTSQILNSGSQEVMTDFCDHSCLSVVKNAYCNSSMGILAIHG